MKKMFLKYRFIFLISIICLAIILLVISIPSNRNKLLPFIARNSLNNFINQSKKDNIIDPNKFWGTQKFYTQAIVSENQSGLNPGQLPKFINETIPQNSREYFIPFKIVAYEVWESVEFMTPIEPYDMTIFSNQIPSQNIELKTDVDLIYRKDNYLYVFFLRPINEGKKSLVITRITQL